MSDHSRMLSTFAAHAEAAHAATDIADFAARTGLAYLAPYAGGWAEFSLRTFKAHPDAFLYQYLMVPEARTLADVFEAARLCSNDIGNQMYRDQAIRARAAITGPGFMFVSASRGKVRGGSLYSGGRLSLRHFPDGSLVRGRFGATFLHTYVRPTAAVRAAWESTMGPSTYDGNGDGFACLAGFELVVRGDGILVIGKDGTGICSRWLALIPLDQAGALFDLLPESDRATVEAAEKVESDFESRLAKDEDGQPYVIDAQAVETVDRGRTFWRAEYRKGGDWYHVANAHGATAEYASRGAALDAAALALGFHIHR